MFLLVELTDICGTITCSLKQSSFLLRTPPSVATPPSWKMQHFRECVVHRLALSCRWLAKLFHHFCPPFTHACNESECADFWKSKRGHRLLSRGAALRCCASSSVGGARRLSGRATRDICRTAAAPCFLISINFTMGGVSYPSQPNKQKTMTVSNKTDALLRVQIFWRTDTRLSFWAVSPTSVIPSSTHMLFGMSDISNFNLVLKQCDKQLFPPYCRIN